MVGATAHMVARVFFCIANSPIIFYVGGAISGLGPVVGPVIRSMTSKVVPLNERGKVFALLAVCDNAVPFFSGTLYTQVSLTNLFAQLLGNNKNSISVINRCTMQL